jgi:protein gp37
MGAVTGISWTGDHGKTWSPWFGCTKVHTGCANCFAEADNARYNRNGDPRGGVAASWGPGAPRKPRAESGWKLPLKWAREAAEAGRRDKVFPSLCDPLDAEIAPEIFARFMQLIRDTSRVGPVDRCGLLWLLLTKRPERAPAIPEDARPLVWLIASVSDQPTADKYVPRLLEAKGFGLLGLSVEPMLGPVDLSEWLVRSRDVTDPDDDAPDGAEVDGMERVGRTWERRQRLSWVICGGESGHKRRTFPGAVDAYRDIREQCRDAGVPFFMKQDSALLPGQQGSIPDDLWRVKEFPDV